MTQIWLNFVRLNFVSPADVFENYNMKWYIFNPFFYFWNILELGIIIFCYLRFQFSVVMVDLVVYIFVQNQSVISFFEEMYLLKTFFIGDTILFIIFVDCLVCFNSIFTTYAIFPYIRSLLCIIWWKIFCNKCLWFCRAIILLLRIKQLLYLGLLSLQFFTVRIIESTCSQVCDIFIEKMVLGLKTAASPFILNILINAKDFFFQNR